MDYCFNNLFGDGIGWNFGVSTWIKNTKKALEKNGLKESPFSKLVISIGLPRAFNPIPDRYNVFMTLFETEDLFDDDYEKMNKADMIIVPCEQNKAVLRKNLRIDLPVFVITGGVDPVMFKYKKRVKPKDDENFYFLYVGAMNPRKGYQLAIDVFKEILFTPNVKLYVKTTAEGQDGVIEEGNIIFDYRVLDTKDLAELYHKCHCLLLPSHGEGIGLTAMEAAATGMPVIHTPFGGTAEFLDTTNSMPLVYTVDSTVLQYPGDPPRERATKWAEVDRESFKNKMRFVIDQYTAQVNYFERSLKKLSKNFSWKAYANKIIFTLASHENIISEKNPRKVLNFGCGNRKYPGTLSLDIRPDVGADIVWDLTKTPYKFAKDGEYDELIIINTLEHLLDPLPFMTEAYRILKKDGYLHIQVPYYKGENFWIDPTHHHAYHELSMDFFDRTTFHGSLNGYIPVNFKVLQRQVSDQGDIYFVLQKKCYEDLGNCACDNGGTCACKK
jgi:glycosyltransferase involved in cell wall biosynthesis